MALIQTEVANGLEFPEGPIVMDDGSIVLVEIAGPRLTRVLPDGSIDVIAEWDDPESAGPNGAAVGPDGHIYVCNNGGFVWSEINGMQFPMNRETGANQSDSYVTGSIDRVDLTTGETIIPFGDYSMLSLDSGSHYFKQDLNTFQPNRFYKIMLKLKTDDNQEIIYDDNFEFKVVR